jgi:hypothetical protein
MSIKYFIIAVIGILMVIWIIQNYSIFNVRERIIDCRIAEISPDIPVWAKEECRKLNRKNLFKSTT